MTRAVGGRSVASPSEGQRHEMKRPLFFFGVLGVFLLLCFFFWGGGIDFVLGLVKIFFFFCGCDFLVCVVFFFFVSCWGDVGVYVDIMIPYIYVFVCCFFECVCRPVIYLLSAF